MVGRFRFSFGRAGASALTEPSACHIRYLFADVLHRGRQASIKRHWEAEHFPSDFWLPRRPRSVLPRLVGSPPSG